MKVAPPGQASRNLKQNKTLPSKDTLQHYTDDRWKYKKVKRHFPFPQMVQSAKVKQKYVCFFNSNDLHSEVNNILEGTSI